MALRKFHHTRIAIMEWVISLNLIQFALLLGVPFGTFMGIFGHVVGNFDVWYIFIPELLFTGMLFGACMRPIVLWQYRIALKKMRDEDSN